MKNYRLSRSAQEDLRQIKQYSLATWGKQKTQKYLADIESMLEILTISPEIGKKREDLMIELHSFPIQQHIIFYRCNQDEIEIVRVLHGRVNISKHFQYGEKY